MEETFIQLSDKEWQVVEKYLSEFSFPKVRGIPRTEFRKIWNSILYILVRGCRWKELPKKAIYATRSTSHRWLQRWQKDRIFDFIFLRILKFANYHQKIDWSQLSLDGSFPPSNRRRRAS